VLLLTGSYLQNTFANIYRELKLGAHFDVPLNWILLNYQFLYTTNSSTHLT